MRKFNCKKSVFLIAVICCVLCTACGKESAKEDVSAEATSDFESAAAAITPLRQNPCMERAKGIEPSWPAWKAGTLPLSYARTGKRGKVYQMCFH